MFGKVRPDANGQVLLREGQRATIKQSVATISVPAGAEAIVVGDVHDAYVGPGGHLTVQGRLTGAMNVDNGTADIWRGAKDLFASGPQARIVDHAEAHSACSANGAVVTATRAEAATAMGRGRVEIQGNAGTVTVQQQGEVVAHQAEVVHAVADGKAVLSQVGTGGVQSTHAQVEVSGLVRGAVSLSDQARLSAGGVLGDLVSVGANATVRTNVQGDVGVYSGGSVTVGDSEQGYGNVEGDLRASEARSCAVVGGLVNGLAQASDGAFISTGSARALEARGEKSRAQAERVLETATAADQATVIAREAKKVVAESNGRVVYEQAQERSRAGGVLDQQPFAGPQRR